MLGADVPDAHGPQQGQHPLEALAVVKLGQVLEAHAPLPGQHVLGVGGEGLAAVGHLTLFAPLFEEHRLALRLLPGPLLPPALRHPPGGGVGRQLFAGAGVPAPEHPDAV